MPKRPFLRKWFTNGEDVEDVEDCDEEDCDEEGVTIDSNDPYLD